MPVSTKQSNRCLFAIATAGCVAGLASLAHGSPIVDFDIAVSGGSMGTESFDWSQNGTAVTGQPGTYNYKLSNGPYPTGLFSDGWTDGESPQPEWGITNYDFNADSMPGGPGGVRMFSVFAVENNLADDPIDPMANRLHFSIMITMQAMPTTGPSSFYGTGAMTLLSPNGGIHDAQMVANGASIWNYMIDGADVADLFEAGPPPYVLGFGNGAGSASTSSSLAATGQAAGLAGMHPNTMSIRLEFDLTPGEKATFNGSFGFVPAPGAMALLGLAGLIGRGRRRR